MAQEGVVPAGPAVPAASPSEPQPVSWPNASPTKPETALGRTAVPIPGQPYSHSLASPSTAPLQVGASANPKTGVPNVGMQVSVKLAEPQSIMPHEARAPQVSSGQTAAPQVQEQISGQQAGPVFRTTESTIPASPAVVQPQAVPQSEPAIPPRAPGLPARLAEVKPFSAGEVRVTSAPTLAGRAATPAILEQIAGLPANLRTGQTVEAKASPTPKTNVTVIVPPAFPMDPAEAFRMVDSQELPPWQGSDRDIPAFKTDAENLESTEQLVARSYMQAEGNRSDVDRWAL